MKHISLKKDFTQCAIRDNSGCTVRPAKKAMLKKLGMYAGTLAIGACLATSAVALTGCGASFEGSGSKDAASAEQLAQKTDDPWKSEIKVDTTKTFQDGHINDGTYTGHGKGMEGAITVTISVSNNRITTQEITQEGESQSVGGYEAIRDGRYAKLIDAAQSYDFGSVSGAALTSCGVRAALVDALNQAGAGLDEDKINNSAIHSRAESDNSTK